MFFQIAAYFHTFIVYLVMLSIGELHSVKW